MQTIRRYGALIESGITDWQIIQQNVQGLANIALQGRWDHPDFKEPRVQARVADENTGVSITTAPDWVDAEMAPDRTWRVVLPNIPAGGLYRVETRLRTPGDVGEWAHHGDMVHHVGVGDLWVIAGQSNSAGYGRGAVHDPPELGVHLFRNSMRWDLASHPMNESTRTEHPENTEGANSSHSPYLAFARVVKHELNFPIGLVQTSLGGSGLAMWNPGEPGPHPLYENMLRCVQAVGGRVKGILWYQGCSDASIEGGRTYLARFTDMVRLWREVLGLPDLVFLTVQVNRCYGPMTPEGAEGWGLVREAQRQAARHITGVYVASAQDLPLSDGIHISPAGNMMLGDRLARACLGGVYRRPTPYLAPDIESAQALTGNQAIELRFRHIADRLDQINLPGNPFAVFDEKGQVRITGVAHKVDRIQLDLDRALAGRTVVHGGYGNDPALVPYDMGRMVPMLAFHNVPVEPLPQA